MTIPACDGSMRIAMVCHSTLGGSARSAARLAAGLAHRGHAVHLISRAALPWPVDDAVSHHRLDTGSMALDDPSSTRWPDALFDRFEAFMRQIIEQEAVEIMHFHYAVPFAQMGARLAASAMGDRTSVVGTLHGTDVTKSTSASARDPLRAALRQAAALTTVSHAHARHARSQFGLAAEPRVIHNFVGADEHRPASLTRARHRDRLSRPRLIHVSNFRAVKSPVSLAGIFARVRESMDAELWLVGDGPELPRVRAALEPSGDHVRVFGMRRDVTPLLAETDLMVLTSLQESFGLVALEAMACGVPVLAPWVGGIPEVVTDGVAGLLFRPGDEIDGAARALELLSDPERHWAMREGALARARDFSEARVVAEYERLYRSLPPRRGSSMPHPDYAATS